MVISVVVFGSVFRLLIWLIDIDHWHLVPLVVWIDDLHVKSLVGLKLDANFQFEYLVWSESFSALLQRKHDSIITGHAGLGDNLVAGEVAWIVAVGNVHSQSSPVDSLWL